MNSNLLRNSTLLGAALLLMLGGFLAGWTGRGKVDDVTVLSCEDARKMLDATLEKSFAQTRAASAAGLDCLNTLKRLHPEMRNP